MVWVDALRAERSVADAQIGVDPELGESRVRHLVRVKQLPPVRDRVGAEDLVVGVEDYVKSVAVDVVVLQKHDSGSREAKVVRRGRGGGRGRGKRGGRGKGRGSHYPAEGLGVPRKRKGKVRARKDGGGGD